MNEKAREGREWEREIECGIDRYKNQVELMGNLFLEGSEMP